MGGGKKRERELLEPVSELSNVSVRDNPMLVLFQVT